MTLPHRDYITMLCKSLIPCKKTNAFIFFISVYLFCLLNRCLFIYAYIYIQLFCTGHKKYNRPFLSGWQRGKNELYWRLQLFNTGRYHHPQPCSLFPFNFIKEKAHPFQRPKKRETDIKEENQPAQQEQGELHNLTWQNENCYAK